jgi:hypothetical protein
MRLLKGLLENRPLTGVLTRAKQTASSLKFLGLKFFFKEVSFYDKKNVHVELKSVLKKAMYLVSHSPLSLIQNEKKN